MTPEQNQELSVIVRDEIRAVVQEEMTKVSSTIIAEVHRESLFIGPIPPPEVLKGYNDCVPDGADRVIKMAENQSRAVAKINQ
jgi:uncharacterized membrane protein